MDTINKEIKNSMVAFEEIEGVPREHIIVYQEVMVHLVFDIKLG